MAYSPLITRKSLEEFFEMIERSESTRPQYVLHTGEEGYNNITRDFKRVGLLQLINILVTENKLSIEESENLHKMLYSPDEENFILAEEILNQLKSK